MKNIATAPEEVKRNPVSFRVGDPDDPLSLAHAVRAGYRLRIESDGTAVVLNPTGTGYHIYDWFCDCPDALFRDGGSYERSNGERVCKHLVWLSQVRPCEATGCDGVMVLVERRTCLGGVTYAFDCPRCGNARDFDPVKQERLNARRRQAALVA